jgi:peptide-methionine (R)-S-oxide reductase
MSDMKAKPESYWKQKLTPEQYRVLREAGTEPAFAGEYTDTEAAGLYACAACGRELFSSETKFHSGSGWPSFWEAVGSDKVELVDDNTHGMQRVEVRCGNCGSHLGHVFDDGPQPSGQRYCINSAALAFDPTKSKTDGN